MQQPILNTRDAAALLCYSERTLRNARSTGVLAGTQPPQHIQMGRTVRYRVSDLESWLSQFDDPHAA